MINKFPTCVRLYGSTLLGNVIGVSQIHDADDSCENMVVVEWDDCTCSREPNNNKLVPINQ